MINMKKCLQAAGAACAATGVIAVSGLVASGAAVGAMIEGFKSATNIMKKILADASQKENSAKQRIADISHPENRDFQAETVAVDSL